MSSLRCAYPGCVGDLKPAPSTNQYACDECHRLYPAALVAQIQARTSASTATATAPAPSTAALTIPCTRPKKCLGIMSRGRIGWNCDTCNFHDPSLSAGRLATPTPSTAAPVITAAQGRWFRSPCCNYPVTPDANAQTVTCNCCLGKLSYQTLLQHNTAPRRPRPPPHPVVIAPFAPSSGVTIWTRGTAPKATRVVTFVASAAVNP